MRGSRQIEEPTPRLQAIHRRVHKLLSRVAAPEHLHSTIKGRSYVTNARAHVGRGGCVKIDVKKFFQSVPRAAVYKFFKEEMQCAGDAAGLLARLLTFRGHLPTGSSCSPILAYYCYRGLFDAVANSAEKAGFTPTTYVDDLSISGNGVFSGHLHDIRRQIAKTGLRSHKAKVIKPGNAKLVTGVIVTAAGIKLPNRRHEAIAKGFADLETCEGPEAELKILNPLISRLHEAGQIDRRFTQRARNLERRRVAAKAALLAEERRGRALLCADQPSTQIMRRVTKSPPTPRLAPSANQG